MSDDAPKNPFETMYQAEPPWEVGRVQPFVEALVARGAINGRVVDNTVQQYLIFVLATLAVAASARGDEVGIVAAAAIIFVTMRFAFWIGYRVNPLYRAFGMSSVAYLNVILLGVAIWMAWR